METLLTFESQPLIGLFILKASQNLQTHHLPLSSLQNPRETQSPKNLEDLIFHKVLPRVPTKSLLRFKTVASHWNTFITSVNFLNIHVRHQPSLNSNSVLTLDNISPSFQFIDYEEGNATKKQSIGCFDWLLSPFVKSQVDRIHGNGIARKKFSRRMIGRSDFLLSSCNGLAFLVSPGDVRCRSGFDYVLYNPVLGPGHFVKIPHPDQNPLGGEDPMTAYLSYGFGFGYVSSPEDYYIVAVNLPRGFDVVVNLYSLRTKEWRYDELTLLTPQGVSSLPLLFQKYWTLNTGTLIKETLYWGIKQGNEHRFIFAYNLAILSYSLLPYPTTFGEITEAFFTDFGLCCFDDCLCAWSQDGRNVVEMLILRDLIWSRLFRIVVDFPAHNFFGFNKTENFLVLGDDQKLYLSDLYGSTRLIAKQKMSNVVNYVPSLESVRAIMNSERNDQ